MIVERLTDKDAENMEWRQVACTMVPRFSVTQWTLLSARGVQLDLSCFSDAERFQQFRMRQQAFREIFWQTRKQLMAKYGEPGAHTFDAYIYLLKAFAAVTLRSALTSFQATCLGIFALQRPWRESYPLSDMPSSLCLMKKFLLVCKDFFG